MESQQNYRQYQANSEIKYFPFQNSQFTPTYSNSNKAYSGSNMASNDIFSTDTDSYSYHNQNYSFEKSKNSENRVVIKKPDEFVIELFKAFGEKNSLCNFSLFEKNIDIDMNLDNNSMKKLSLLEYFDVFNEASILCLNVPFLDKKGNISYNIFNPTLSSMNLVLKDKRIKEENINKNFLKDNYSLNFMENGLIKVEFDETNPPYNRDIIEAKINTLYRILGQKKIMLDNIIQDQSFFSILWTPADTYRIKSSFLSFYTFNFKLIGTLIIKIDEYNWFTIFCNDMNNYKDFKKEYLNKINVIENFIQKCNSKNDCNLERKFFSHDYKRFIYNL